MIRLIIVIALFASASAKAEFVPVCERSQQVQKIFQYNFHHKPCYAIGESDLKSIYYFQVFGYDQVQLNAGDLAGLSNVTQIVFYNIDKLDIAPNVFSDTPKIWALTFNNINTLKLRDTQAVSQPASQTFELSEVEPGALRDLKNLIDIAFIDVGIRRIQPDTFVDLPSLEAITLACPLLDQIDDDSFIGLPNLKKVDLKDSEFISPVRKTRKAAFRGVPLVFGLRPDFDVENTSDHWGTP